MRTLGKFFSRNVKKMEGHKIVSDGPYQFVRHPGLFFHNFQPIVNTNVCC